MLWKVTYSGTWPKETRLKFNGQKKPLISTPFVYGLHYTAYRVTHKGWNCEEDLAQFKYDDSKGSGKVVFFMDLLLIGQDLTQVYSWWVSQLYIRKQAVYASYSRPVSSARFIHERSWYKYFLEPTRHLHTVHLHTVQLTSTFFRPMRLPSRA